MAADRNINARVTITDATASGIASANKSLGRLGSALDQSLASVNRRQDNLVKNQSASLRSEFTRIQRAVDPLSRSTAAYNRDLSKLKQAQREGVISSREYSQTLEGLNNRLKKAEERAKGTRKSFVDMSLAFRQVAAAGAAIGGGVSIGFLARDAVAVASDYERQLNAVKAVTDATTSEMSELNKEARDLGSSTAFSARESAQAMEELGQAGFSAREIMAAVGGTLDLAAAGNIELARAAEISSSVMRGFNLEASQSVRVSDVLALASVKSNASISDLGEAMKFAAPTAAAFSISLEEATASVSKLADSGLRGGLGGRGFQAVVTQLVKEKDKVEDLIGAFDLQAEGLTAVIKRIAAAGPTQAQAIEIFKGENFDVFSILKNAALDAAAGTDALTESLKNADGEAKRIASTKFQGVAKAFDELKGAREDIFIEVGQSGGLAATEKLVNAITAKLRSWETINFANSIGKNLSAAVETLAKNWGAVTDAMKAATAAALIWGTTAAAAFAGKTIASIVQFVARAREAVLIEQLAAGSALASARAQAALTAARVADIAAGRVQIQTNLAILATQKAEALAQLELAKGITVATGITSAETAARARLVTTMRAQSLTRRALLATEAEAAAAETAAAAAAGRLTIAQNAAAVSAGRLSVAQGGVAASMGAGIGATVGMSAALGRLALAANGAGAALAFASVGGAAGLARGIAGVSIGIARAGAGVAALAAVNLGRLIAQFTGLSAVIGVLGGPITAAVVGVGALAAAFVVFRKDIAFAVAGVRDLGVAMQAVRDSILGSDVAAAMGGLSNSIKTTVAVSKSLASAIGSALLQTQSAAPAVRTFDQLKSAIEGAGTVAAGFAVAAKTLTDLAVDFIVPPEVTKAWNALGGAINSVVEAARKLPGELVDKFRNDVNGRASQLQGLKNLTPKKDVSGDDRAPYGVLLDEKTAAGRNAFVYLRKEALDYTRAAVDATGATDGLSSALDGLGDAGSAAGKAQDDLANKIKSQRIELEAQAAAIEEINKAKAGGASDFDIKVIEKRQALVQQYSELAKADAALIDNEARRLALAEQRSATLDAVKSAEKERVRELASAQEEAARDLIRQRDDLARGFTDVFIDVWRSFRKEGLSAIDVIKDALRNTFENILGRAFEDAVRPLAEQLLTGRSPEINQAGQIFTQAALEARALGLSGSADPFGQSPGVSTAGITTSDLQATLNGQTNILNNLIGGLKSSAEQFINLGTNLGQSLGSLFGKGAGALLGKLGGGAAGGFAGFQFGGGIADIFNGRQGETGSKLGGAIGGGIGFAFGPVGAAIGAAAGGFIGDILGGLFGRKTGKATVNLTSGVFSDVKDSKKDARNELRDAIGQGAFEAISAIKDLLGATLSSALGLQISVGKKSATATLIDQRTGQTIGSTPLDRNDIDAAIKSALKLVIDSGFQGISPTLAKVTKALAATSLPAETLVSSLGAIKSALEFGDDPPSQWAEALKSVTQVFGEAINAAGGLASAIKDLTDVQLEALEKIASSFDEDIDKKLRTLKSPVEQEAIDIFEEQLKRLADATAINDAVAAARAGASSAPSIPPSGAFPDVDFGFGGGASQRFAALRGDGLQFAGLRTVLADAATAAGAMGDALAGSTSATAAAAAAANDNSEAQARLARVNELAQAEWEAFIKNAGSTPEGLAAVAAALASVGDRAAELGIDLAALNDQLASVKQSLASAFDKDIESQRLAIEAPQQAAALALIEQQTTRMEAARAVSSGAADEQERLSRVVALNTTEWQKFIKEASSTPEALSDAAAALERFAEEARALGADPALLNRQLQDARAQLAGEFNTDVAERLLALANPTLAQFNDLLKEQKKRTDTAAALGANVSGAERLNALERRRFFEGLSDDQKTELGDFLGIIEDFSGRYAFVLSEFLGSTEKAREALEDTVAGYEESAAAWKSATDQLKSSLEGIRSEFAPGNLSEQLALSTRRFDEALAQSQDPNASLDDRREAFERLGSLGQETLRIGRDLFGTQASTFGALFERITSALEGAVVAGTATETSETAQAAAARAAADSLAAIERQLSQPDLSLPILEESRGRLAAIEDVNSRQVELLDELIAIEKARAAQQEFSIGLLAGINSPLVQSSGDPAVDAEAARIMARAIAENSFAVASAIGTQSDINEIELGAIKTELSDVKNELGAIKTLLRNVLEGLVSAA